MPLFRSPRKVSLPVLAVERARWFAANVIGTVDYSDSRQTDSAKVTDDHYVSKLGEEAVRQLLITLGFTVDGPDYAIYPGRQKSWGADLRINGRGVAVKTQRRSTAKKFGLSWTFQCGKTRRDAVLDDPEAWVFFVEYDDSGDGLWDLWVYPPYKVGKLRFRPPKKRELIGEKQVVYAEDLPAHHHRKG